MGSEYLTAMEEFDINLHTSCEREWDVEEEILMLDPLFKEMMLGSADRLRGTHNISSDGIGHLVRRVPIRITVGRSDVAGL